MNDRCEESSFLGKRLIDVWGSWLLIENSLYGCIF